MNSDVPPIYLLPTHLSADELRKWEERIPSLTKDPAQAKFIVGKISTPIRAQFELRKLRLPMEEILPVEAESPPSPKVKRQKIRDPEDETFLGEYPSELDDGNIVLDGRSQGPDKVDAASREATVKVVRLAWLQDSTVRGRLLDYKNYLIYEAVKKTKKETRVTPTDLMRRAREVAAGGTQTSPPQQVPYRRYRDGTHHVKIPLLLPHSTTDENMVGNLPPVPEYLQTPYSCQRPTFVHPPNEVFIEKLKEIRELRAMKGDDIGVRAYSSAIASLSAYPYKLQSPMEILRLPGCGEKYAQLFAEFENTGQVSELQRAATDAKMSVVRTFYNIWGVSAVTAEEFYRKGWRDLDDVVEFGWNSTLLHRSQQIGVKYYDEFLQKIPRSETAFIANIVLEHANALRKGFQMTVVGGYRRGKTMSGDVDLILSHPDEEATDKFIKKLVTSLIDSKFITHSLTVSEHNSDRGQRPTSFKSAQSGGTGFDTLDKALVVWQNPDFEPTPSSPKNPNPHRRVDIIISPWKTVGCAVLGWSSETTFQRDLRRYCKERGLKFDSSGIRSREAPFNWVDLEDGGRGPPESMEEAEKRVFEGLELEWRPPEERCTG